MFKRLATAQRERFSLSPVAAVCVAVFGLAFEPPVAQAQVRLFLDLGSYPGPHHPWGELHAPYPAYRESPDVLPPHEVERILGDQGFRLVERPYVRRARIIAIAQGRDGGLWRLVIHAYSGALLETTPVREIIYDDARPDAQLERGERDYGASPPHGEGWGHRSYPSRTSGGDASNSSKAPSMRKDPTLTPGNAQPKTQIARPPSASAPSAVSSRETSPPPAPPTPTPQATRRPQESSTPLATTLSDIGPQVRRVTRPQSGDAPQDKGKIPPVFPSASGSPSTSGQPQTISPQPIAPAPPAAKP